MSRRRFAPLTPTGRGVRALRNRARLRAKHLDTILIRLPASMPPLPTARGGLLSRAQAMFFGAPPLSLWELENIFDRIAADPRPKTVVLILPLALTLPFADMESLRAIIGRFRAKARRVIAWAQSYDLNAYFVASAADSIWMQPGGDLLTLGLRSEAVFFKDAFASVGVALDVVAISPYKGAFDQFSRADFSPEGRAQLDWLLDSRYATLIDGIAASRSTTPNTIRAMIDGAPHRDDAALSARYVDALLFEDELPGNLKVERLTLWRDAKRRLIRPYKPRPATDNYIAVLPVSGLMLPGESGDAPPIPIPLPFVGEDRAGDQTVVRQVRHLLDDQRAAAVVLFIDSGGGASIAAENMGAALDRLAADRPMIAYMNGAAASGGYDIAVSARQIIAQRGTITGSIGVVTAKPVTGGLREKLHVHSVAVTRGANAALFSDSAPFTDAERAQVRALIEHGYARFIARVAQRRHMSVAAVDAIGGGRVWTGAQAVENGLVDQLGDLRAALAAARAAANLPDDTPIVFVADGGKPIAPFARTPDKTLSYWLENARALTNGATLRMMALWLNERDRR